MQERRQNSQELPCPVDNFASSYGGDRFAYPGDRATENFLTDGNLVQPLPADNSAAYNRIQEYLTQQELPGLDDRIAVLSYGSNLNPKSLKEKLAKYSAGSVSQQLLQTVPCIMVELPDHDVIWHGKPGQKGGYFAELYNGPEVKGGSVEVGVLFLTKEQLAAIHTTEGTTYKVADVGDLRLSDELAISLVGYVGTDSSMLLDNDGAPIAVHDVNRRDGRLAELSCREAVNFTLGSLSVKSLFNGVHLTADQFKDRVEKMSLAERKALQASMNMALQYDDRNDYFQYAAPSYGRADFNNLPSADGKHHHPQTLQLMEQSIAGIRPSADEIAKRAGLLLQENPDMEPGPAYAKARRQLDPATVIRQRAVDEIHTTLQKTA